ncbi:RRQRL motif-containing zinc-binding protein [Streptomyces sp. NBC_01361]|uniref:RRQRL motif-containing zinc-binding protein n=1 Tax=Streptomyces sp. NBC_01361 TaxID=2903838 RepID=UPI002E2F80CF|nr:RRQRL motif-containing zinc-binding protein [Streptomyces sp. NBC_01361]
MPRINLRYLDPEGERFGIPTWPWRMGPPQEEWATMRQLEARGLRPGGQPVAGQLGWKTRTGDKFAYLYRVELALKKRPMTEAKWASIHKATQARKVCPTCKTMRDYEIPKRYGVCNDCPGGANEAAAAA